MANQPDSVLPAGFNQATRSTVWKCEDCHSRWNERLSEHKCPAAKPTLQSLLESHGSFRRLLEAYWTSQLSPAEERIIEDATPKETIASFKPVECIACAYQRAAVGVQYRDLLGKSWYRETPARSGAAAQWSQSEIDAGLEKASE